MIYFLESEAAGLIKIGYTNRHPSMRQAQLESIEKTKLVLLGVMDGGPADERALHHQFGPFRVRGEWFQRHADIIEFARDNAGPVEALEASYDASPRAQGFSIYPSTATLAAIDKLAVAEDRKRAPMALVLIKKGIEAMTRKAAK